MAGEFEKDDVEQVDEGQGTHGRQGNADSRPGKKIAIGLSWRGTARIRRALISVVRPGTR